MIYSKGEGDGVFTRHNSKDQRLIWHLLAKLPSFPGPWTISNGEWYSGSQRVACVGANLTGEALMPTTQAAADMIAETLFREGYRLVRVHHWDNLLNGNVQAYTQRLDYLTSALKKFSIPWITDGSSERCDKALLYAQNAAERSKWQAQVDHLLTHTPGVDNVSAWVDEPFFLGLCPVNEDTTIDGTAPWDGSALSESQYVDNQNWYRTQLTAMGYSGATWPSNAGMPGAWANTIPGEVEVYHRYVDHQNDGPPIVYWDTYDDDQPWNQYVPRNSARPLMLEEMGKLWPSEVRGLCEKQIVDHAISQGCQVIIPFARATRANLMDATGGALESYTYYNDPVRLNTVRYAALMLSGGLRNLAYTHGNAQNTGFTSSVISGPQKQVTNSGTAPIVESVSGTVSVPAGKQAIALDATGKRTAKLAVVDGEATATSIWTELV